MPFPDAEQKAVDVVMQYAINKLDFSPENIVLFAWSIGGYSASWAAMSYPEVKYVVSSYTWWVTYFKALIVSVICNLFFPSMPW